MMASSSAGPSAVAPSIIAPTKANQLYEKCAETDSKRPGALFYQADLAAFDIAADTQELLQICQDLVDKHLFQTFQESGSVCWKIRKRDQATLLLSMTADQRMIYTQIEASGSNGIWIKTLKGKTNLPQNTLTKALKGLDSGGLIKQIVSAKYSGRRIWILSHLDPSEENTGGRFFSEGKIDEAFVGELYNVVNLYVKRESWREARSAKSKKSAQNPESSNGANPLKRKAEDDILDRPRYKPMESNKGRPLVPRASTFTTYPNPQTIHHFIHTSGIVKQFNLSVDDVQQLLNNMVFDGQLEKIGMGYRTVKEVPGEDDEGEGNGLTGAPCGSCPVFSVCAPGNVISAETCVYFEDWLKW